MKYKPLIILLICFSSQLFSQEEPSIKSVSTCVVFLNDTKIEKLKTNEKAHGLNEENKNNEIPKIYRTYGTAFFVTDSVYSFYLVTAEHLAKDMTLNSDIVINGENDKPIIFKLKDITLRKDSLIWTYNKSADVATLLLDNYSTLLKNSKASFIPLCYIEAKCIPPLREREVTTIGFPLGIGYNNYFSPISKISKPSSGLIEYPRFDNQKISTFFFLDDPSISGFSGSPVFELPTEYIIGNNKIFVSDCSLIGLVHGSLGDKTGGGFAAIVPASYIVETIKISPKYSGILKCEYKNGKLWSERMINNGKPWTVLNNFDKNGNSMEKGSLKNGNGSLFIYNEEGKLEFIENYLNGILINTEKK
jgi:Uncharacterized protein conserved in bacteria